MMAKRKVLVLQNEEEWKRYLLEAFEDTSSKPQMVETAQEILPLIRQGNPDMIFANGRLLTPPVIAAIRVRRASNQNFRLFGLGDGMKGNPAFPFDETFKDIPLGLYEFQRRLVEHVPLPDPIHLLVVDDEPQIGDMFREYFDRRTDPAFRLRTTSNGLEAQKEIQKSLPHVMVLDIKMPKQDGRELYGELKKRGLLPPTIVFFDAVSVDEVIEIRRLGNLAFVEKGSRSSSMPEMSALIKKIAFFG